MNPFDITNLVMRIIMLNLIGATSEIALKKRLFAMWFFLMTLFFTMFRLTLLRVVAMYIGVFAHEPKTQVNNLLAFLSSSSVVNFTDAFLFLGIIVIFLMVHAHQRSIKN